MKIIVRRTGMKMDDDAWRAEFGGWFIGRYQPRRAYGATAEEAVRNLLSEAHSLVYRIRRRDLVKNLGLVVPA